MTDRRVGPPKAVPGGRSWPDDHDHQNCYYRTSAACTGFGRAPWPQRGDSAAAIAAAERAVRASNAAAARRKARQRRIDRILLALFLTAAIAITWYIHLHGLFGSR